jgi:hypothetical protein
MPIRTDGHAVSLPHGTALLERTALEFHRLATQRDAIDYLLEQKSETLRLGLAERNVTRLELAGLDIRRNGRHGVTVRTIPPER